MFSPDNERKPIVLPPHHHEPVRIIPTIKEMQQIKLRRHQRYIMKGQENMRRFKLKYHQKHAIQKMINNDLKIEKARAEVDRLNVEFISVIRDH